MGKELIGKLGKRNRDAHAFLDKLNGGSSNLTLKGTYVSEDGKLFFQSKIVKNRFDRKYGPDFREKFGNYSSEIYPDLARYVVAGSDSFEDKASEVIGGNFATNDYFIYSHSGNRLPLAGLENLTDAVIEGKAEAKRLLFHGKNGVGKSHLGKYLAWKLAKNNVLSSYVNVLDVVNWATSRPSSWIHPAIGGLDGSRLLIVDELNKIHNIGDELRGPTSRNLLNIFNKADDNGIPTVMFYTGDVKSLSSMIYDMKSQKGESSKKKVVRDLGSRVVGRSYGELRMMPVNEVSGFVKGYLASKDNVPDSIMSNVGEFADAIAEKTSNDYDFRKLVTDVDAVLFSADSHASLKIPFGVENVSEVLGYSEQGNVFGREFSDELSRSVAEHVGVRPIDIRKGRQTLEITAARMLTAHLLDKKEWSQGDIADVIGRNRSRVPGLLSKFDGIIGGNVDGKRDRKMASIFNSYLDK